MASESSSLQNKCNHSSIESNDLKRYSKCKLKYYCNSICHQNDWLCHKQFCKSQTEINLSHTTLVDKSDMKRGSECIIPEEEEEEEDDEEDGEEEKDKFVIDSI